MGVWVLECVAPAAAPAETHIIQQLALHPQLPRCNAAVRVVGVGSGGVEGVGYVKSQFTLLLLTRRHGEKSTVQAEEERIRAGRGTVKQVQLQRRALQVPTLD